MIRTIGEMVIAFDCEWIPDAQSAQLLYPDAEGLSEAELLQKLWEGNGATEENPQPFVRLMQSRVVSIAMMIREVKPHLPKENQVELRLVWLPKKPDEPASRDERKVVGGFLAAVGNRAPQLVGFNSRNSDLRILAQRALALGIPAKGFLNRPAKPWEGVDYFGRDCDASIDLMELIAGGFSGRNAAVSLHEAATLCGIPGKFGSHGDQVFEMWQQERYRDIVEYNCYDAITTYLLWLRLAWISGRFSEDEYEAEQELLRQHLMGLTEDPETEFIGAFLEEWDRLQNIKDQIHPRKK
jgi:predicted PolB exonuclease-like 3'-5' exonuclease